MSTIALFRWSAGHQYRFWRGWWARLSPAGSAAEIRIDDIDGEAQSGEGAVGGATFSQSREREHRTEEWNGAERSSRLETIEDVFSM